MFRFGKTIFMSLPPPLPPAVKAPRVSSRKLEYPARLSAKILSRNCTRRDDRHRSQPDKMEISSWRPFRDEARRRGPGVDLYLESSIFASMNGFRCFFSFFFFRISLGVRRCRDSRGQLRVMQELNFISR